MAIFQLIGLATALSAIYSVWTTVRNPLFKVPGPWYAKWTSIVVTYYWLQGKRSHYIHSLHEKYGPVVLISPGEVYFSDLDAVKTIYSHREEYIKSPWYRRVTTTPMETIFGTSDIDYHRRHRRLLGGPMAETALAQHLPTIQRRVDLAISRMREESAGASAGGSTDVWKWSLFMATDIIGELTFGESFKTLELGKSSTYTDDLKRVAPLAAVRVTFPSLIKLTAILPIPALRAARGAATRMRQYAVDSLSRYSRILQSDPARARQTLLTRAFDAAADGEKLSFDELCTDAMSYIVAGSDTTANTLTYLIWAVCRRPDIKARLLAELRSLPEGWTEADLRRLPYLNGVIEEGLRCHPAVPAGLPRIAPPNGAQLAGYWIPGGTTVVAQSFSLHLNPNVFPNPEAFDPTRWESPTAEMKDSLFSFGRGARVCLGKHLAYIELRLATARFFLEFPDAEVSTHEGMSDDDMAPKIWFLIMPSGQRCLIKIR